MDRVVANRSSHRLRLHEVDVVLRETFDVLVAAREFGQVDVAENRDTDTGDERAVGVRERDRHPEGRNPGGEVVGSGLLGGDRVVGIGVAAHVRQWTRTESCVSILSARPGADNSGLLSRRPK